jgi:hypothetical protein
MRNFNIGEIQWDEADLVTRENFSLVSYSFILLSFKNEMLDLLSRYATILQGLNNATDLIDMQ